MCTRLTTYDVTDDKKQIYELYHHIDINTIVYGNVPKRSDPPTIMSTDKVIREYLKPWEKLTTYMHVLPLKMKRLELLDSLLVKPWDSWFNSPELTHAHWDETAPEHFHNNIIPVFIEATKHPKTSIDKLIKCINFGSRQDQRIEKLSLAQLYKLVKQLNRWYSLTVVRKTEIDCKRNLLIQKLKHPIPGMPEDPKLALEIAATRTDKVKTLLDYTVIQLMGIALHVYRQHILIAVQQK